MIAPERFVAESSDRSTWLEARRAGVTATEVSRASTAAGFREVVADRLTPVELVPNGYMEFGSAHESWISMFIKREFGIMPNRWLIAAEDERRFLSTPDGLSLDHARISEVKTGGTVPKSPPMQHRRQVNWQFRTTGASECVYAFMLRAEVNGVLTPAWLEPKTWLIERDEQLIAELERTAHLLLLDLTERSAA